jgi:hypothetical protein
MMRLVAAIITPPRETDTFFAVLPITRSVVQTNKGHGFLRKRCLSPPSNQARLSAGAGFVSRASSFKSSSKSTGLTR